MNIALFKNFPKLNIVLFPPSYPRHLDIGSLNLQSPQSAPCAMQNGGSLDPVAVVTVFWRTSITPYFLNLLNFSSYDKCSLFFLLFLR